MALSGCATRVLVMGNLTLTRSNPEIVRQTRLKPRLRRSEAISSFKTRVSVNRWQKRDYKSLTSEAGGP